MLVTTSYDPSNEELEEAVNLARSLGARLVRRGHSGLSKLRSRYSDNEIMLVTRDGLRFDYGGDHPLFFHPSMSLVRYKRIRQNMPDALLELSKAKPGDVVVDCTAGLASDSIIFSYAAGPKGQVIAWENSPVLASLLEAGLRTYVTGHADFDDAMRRIEVRHGDHLSGLRAMPDRSCDIVYFDPMFRSPIEQSSGISPLRSTADDRALEAAAVMEARRVARRCVILKESRESSEFTRLGFNEVTNSGAKLAYGVISC
ncbi:class I SAM-dependent methyltransferase [Paenibacillus sp. FJAT-26967]|uniref:class I SAM-dependent methyltransferase n=1 Tax=Paenibacillus sp. FJAT-26967 TaxID=1729690 RepID=UPI0008380184|nr:class I SAM-dependent methyltransferase [Paenibacillus sp. FJAT-26967]